MYYTYVYLDPRKSGQFTYSGLNVSFLYEPIYVGKGQGNRSQVHVSKAKNNSKYESNKLKINKLKKILDAGFEPIICIVFNDSEELLVLSKEIEFVKAIGRIDLKTGPLTNLTDGGEGTLNAGPITRFKMRQAKLGNKASEETKEKHKIAMIGNSNHFFGRSHSEETKTLISENRKGKRAGEDHPMFGKQQSEEARKSMSESHKKLTGELSSRSKRYRVISPEGEEFIFSGNFVGFCKEHKIPSPQYLRQIAQCKRKYYLGWSCEYLD